MTVERNHVIAFVMILVDFFIDSKNSESLLDQLETMQVLVFV